MYIYIVHENPWKKSRHAYNVEYVQKPVFKTKNQIVQTKKP